MTALEFAELARRLSATLRDQGVDVPCFRSPPRSPGLGRSLCRAADGSVQVAVRLRGRSPLAVASDMIDGAVAANRQTGAAAAATRDALWSAAEPLLRSPSSAADGSAEGLAVVRSIAA